MNTPQERAWAGEHGDEYNRRCPGDEEANFYLFERALSLGAVRPYFATPIRPSSILELGAGQGANLRALRRLLPKAELTALELNRQAADVLGATASCRRVIHASVLDWEPDRTWDLVLTKGLLIHIHPTALPTAYQVIHQAAARWILLAEYYNPTPVELEYQGREGLLFKRDFAGEMLDRYKDMQLVDYGFVYKRAPQPQDDLTWFLMEKQ